MQVLLIFLVIVLIGTLFGVFALKNEVASIFLLGVIYIMMVVFLPSNSIGLNGNILGAEILTNSDLVTSFIGLGLLVLLVGMIFGITLRLSLRFTKKPSSFIDKFIGLYAGIIMIFNFLWSLIFVISIILIYLNSLSSLNIYNITQWLVLTEILLVISLIANSVAKKRQNKNGDQEIVDHVETTQQVNQEAIETPNSNPVNTVSEIEAQIAADLDKVHNDNS